MQRVPIGSFTILVNVARGTEWLMTPAVIQNIAKVLVDEINNILKDKFEQRSVIVSSYKVSRGCIILFVSFEALLALTVAGAGALSAGVYKFVTDYDKIKKNMKELSKDIKNWVIKIRHKKNQSNNLPTDDEINIYRQTPNELKKYALGERGIFIISEKEVTSINKVCIMREDIIEEITTVTVQKEIRTIVHK